MSCVSSFTVSMLCISYLFPRLKDSNSTEFLYKVVSHLYHGTCCTLSFLGCPVSGPFLNANPHNFLVLIAVLQVTHPSRAPGFNRHMQPVRICFVTLHIKTSCCRHFLILYLYLASELIWPSHPLVFQPVFFPLISPPVANALCSLSKGSRPGTRVPALWRRPVQWKLASKHPEKDTLSQCQQIFGQLQREVIVVWNWGWRWAIRAGECVSKFCLKSMWPDSWPFILSFLLMMYSLSFVS